MKLAIAKRAARMCRFIPFLRAMFVCNTVAQGTALPASDIDVFIVIRHGRLWLSRLFITVLLSLFRLRRHGQRVANRICLSFYVTDQALDFRPLRIDGTDPYFAYWVHQLIPLFDPDGIYKKIKEENAWAVALIPNASVPFQSAPHIFVPETTTARILRRIFETIWQGTYGDLLERHAQAIQRKKMERHAPSRQNNGGAHVIVNDTVLKFHEEDRRKQFRDAWEKRLAELGVKN